MLPMNKIFTSVWIGVLLAGCSSVSPEELDRLIKEDSGFKQMIQARDENHRQINLIKQDLLDKKKLIDAQVDRVRREYDVYAKAQNLKIEKYQAAIDAGRNLLRRETETAAAQLNAKLAESDGYEKTLADVKRVLEGSKGIHLSQDEKERWQERVAMLTEKIRPLVEEIQELKLQIRLKKQKINFLR